MGRREREVGADWRGPFLVASVLSVHEVQNRVTPSSSIVCVPSMYMLVLSRNQRESLWTKLSVLLMASLQTSGFHHMHPVQCCIVLTITTCYWESTEPRESQPHSPSSALGSYAAFPTNQKTEHSEVSWTMRNYNFILQGKKGRTLVPLLLYYTVMKWAQCLRKESVNCISLKVVGLHLAQSYSLLV